MIYSFSYTAISPFPADHTWRKCVCSILLKPSLKPAAPLTGLSYFLISVPLYKSLTTASITPDVWMKMPQVLDVPGYLPQNQRMDIQGRPLKISYRRIQPQSRQLNWVVANVSTVGVYFISIRNVCYGLLILGRFIWPPLGLVLFMRNVTYLWDYRKIKWDEASPKNLKQ